MTIAKPGRSRWLKYLHWIGYATTALVAAQLLFAAYFVVSDWWSDRQKHAAQRESTRTHIGELAERRPIPEWQAGLLAALPKGAATAPDSIRFAIAPSLSTDSYAVALTPSALRGAAAVVDFVMARADSCDVRTPLKIEHRRFTLSAAEYRAFAQWFDTTTDDYAGSSELVLDGTSLAFERRMAGRVTSGIGNGGHYKKLAAQLHALLKPHLAGPDIPSDPGWRVPPTEADCAP